MRGVSWVVAAVVAVVLGAVGVAVGSGLNQTAVVAQLTAADHEVEEGYFSLGEGATVIARPGSELHRWLSAHRGQKVRLRVETTMDGRNAEPAMRPGGGRESGAVSWHLKR